MKNLIIGAILSVLIILPSTSFAFRCGTDIAQIGDLKYEISLACGQPIAKEIIGYIDKEKNGDRITVLQIEEWIYKISMSNYRLVFEGNKLVEIERLRKK